MGVAKKVDRWLRNRGFGGIDDRNLVHQMAFMVRDHKHFRNILMAVEQDKRKLAYEAMSPHLQFNAKSLADYELEARQEADTMRLPTYHAADDIRPYKPAEVGEKLQAKIEDALGRAVIEMQAETKRGRLTVTCRKCIAEASAFVNDRQEGYLALTALGWKFEGDKAVCPECNA